MKDYAKKTSILGKEGNVADGRLRKSGRFFAGKIKEESKNETDAQTVAVY